MASERDMVAGMLAVRLGLATPAQVQAVHTLASDDDGAAGLVATLESMGLISPPQRAMVERMTDGALVSHAGDLEATVDSVGGLGGLRQAFGLAATLASANDAPQPVDGVTTAPLPDVDAHITVTPEQPGRYTPPDGADDARELGRGGIGRVLVVRDSHLGRDVALKELLGQASPGSVRGSGTAPDLAMSRFLREARITGQLEHPSIVPVYELGQRRDGTLYYTMKVVQGRTLADALSACGGLAERLRLITHYSDLCHAMAYAHSRGVVHRDLKPGNVMVGAFGETVLLDWGLAKPVEHPEQRGPGVAVAPPTTGELDEADLAATAEGSLLGTPLYMSPEQARGELDTIGPQSDVWSLGVMLYELLTGFRPFGGRGALHVLQAVTQGQYTPVRERCPEAPPELAAVVDRALALDLDVRYPDAKALADEIDAWLTGGRVGAYQYGLGELLKRFARQHRVALGVGAVALVLLAVTAVVGYLNVRSERDRALAAEASAREAHRAAMASEAEAHAAAGEARDARDRAEGLVQYMVGELREQLEPLGRLDLIDGVIARVTEQYRAEPDGLDVAANPKRARSRAATLMVIARLASARGRSRSAAEAALEARALFHALSVQSPSREAVHDLARADLEVYRTLERRGQRDEAAARAAAALELLTPLTEVPDADPVHILSRAEAHVALGGLAATGGRLAEAERHFRDALTQRHRLIERDPDNLRWQYAVSLGHDRVGNALLDMGRVAEAKAAYTEALTLRAKLVAARPGNLLWVHKLGVSHDQLGDVAMEEGDPRAAERAFDQAGARIGAASEANPTHRGWRRDLAVARLKQGDAQAAMGQTIAALTTYRAAESMLEELVAEGQGALDWVRDLNVARWRRVDQLIALNRLDRARTLVEASLDDAMRIATAARGNARYRHDVAIANFKRGDLAGRQGDAIAAAVAYRQAAKILAPMAQSDASNITVARDLNAARRRLAAVVDRGALDKGALWAAIKASDAARARLDAPVGGGIKPKPAAPPAPEPAAPPADDPPPMRAAAPRPAPPPAAKATPARRAPAAARPRPAAAPAAAPAPAMAEADEAPGAEAPEPERMRADAERADEAGTADDEGAMAGEARGRAKAEAAGGEEIAAGGAAGGAVGGGLPDPASLLDDPDLAITDGAPGADELTPLHLTADSAAQTPRTNRPMRRRSRMRETPRPRPAPARPRIRPKSEEVPERPGQ